MNEEHAVHQSSDGAPIDAEHAQDPAPREALTEVESLTDLIDHMDRIAFLKVLSRHGVHELSGSRGAAPGEEA